MEEKYILELTKKEINFLFSATRNYRAQIHKLSLPVPVLEDLNSLIGKTEKIFFQIQEYENSKILGDESD